MTDFLFYDDDIVNCKLCSQCGVNCQQVDKSMGLNWVSFIQGLSLFKSKQMSRNSLFRWVNSIPTPRKAPSVSLNSPVTMNSMNNNTMTSTNDDDCCNCHEDMLLTTTTTSSSTPTSSTKPMTCPTPSHRHTHHRASPIIPLSSSSTDSTTNCQPFDFTVSAVITLQPVVLPMYRTKTSS